MTRSMNRFKKFDAVILGLGMLGFILLSHVPETGAEIEQEQECHAQMRKFCEGNLEQNVGEFHRCLESHLADLPQSCQWEWKQLVEMHKREMAACGDDYRKLCGIDKDKLKAANYEQAAEKVTACVGENLGLLSDGCWEFVKETSGPLLEGMDREKLRREALQKTQQRKKVKVKGTGWVTAEAQEGDVIWYQPAKRNKKVLDRYPFCPEVKGKDLEEEHNTSMGICYYVVKAAWGEELAKELINANLLAEIDHFGIHRGANLLNQNPSMEDIITKYSVNCPEGFHAEVYNDKYRNEVTITCEKTRQGYETCREGYVKSYYEDGYFGCVKLASCQEMNPGFVEFGKGCVECDRGGCIDQDMFNQLNRNEQDNTYQYIVGPVCRVNYENPENTSACSEYSVAKQYDYAGRLKDEYFRNLGRLIKSYRYDNDGRMEAITEYDENGRLIRAYDAQGNPMEQVVISVYCEKIGIKKGMRLCEEYLYDFRTKQKERITEYVYSKDGRIREEIFYRNGDSIKRYRYDQNGKLEAVTEYKDGMPLREYYADGAPKEERIERTYEVDGRMSGEHIYNNKTGTPIKSVYYDPGGGVRVFEFQYNGNVRITRQCNYNKEGQLEWESTWENKGRSMPVWSISTQYDHDGKIISKEKRVWDHVKSKYITYPCSEGVCP